MGGDRQLKKPKIEGTLHLAAPPEPKSTQQLTPVFCLRYLAKGYTVKDCEDVEAAMFLAKLAVLCQLEWREIAKTPREGNGHEWIPIDQIRAHLPDRVTADVSALQVFRFAGPKARILGLRRDRVFEVYLIDPKGSAYSHS